MYEPRHSANQVNRHIHQHSVVLVVMAARHYIHSVAQAHNYGRQVPQTAQGLDTTGVFLVSEKTRHECPKRSYL